MRFSRREDMELVLGMPATNAPFSLIWRPWRRTSMASGGSFRFRVLVGLRRVPLHARSAAIALTILGSACTCVELAPPGVALGDEELTVSSSSLLGACTRGSSLRRRSSSSQNQVCMPTSDRFTAVPTSCRDYDTLCGFALSSTRIGTHHRRPRTMATMSGVLLLMTTPAIATTTATTPGSTTAGRVGILVQ